MKVRCGTTLPQTSRQAYVLAAKSTHSSKGNFHQANNFGVKQHMYLIECLQNHLLFYTDVLPTKGKNQRCLMDLTTWLYLCCDHIRSDAQIQLFAM